MPGPTFTPGYVAPGLYVQQQDVSTPTVPQGTRIPAAIGQGSKTLLRSDRFVKGTKNGIDGPMSKNIVVRVVSVIDTNSVVYTQGVDFLLTRPTPTTASIDWSPKASLTGSADISLLPYPTGAGSVDGLTFLITVDGVTFPIVFSLPANAADIVSQINSWDPALVGVASLNVSNQLVLTANSITIQEASTNTLLGFITGEFAAVGEPATGVSYTVQYLSDKTADEYLPQLFSNMNSTIAYYGPLLVPTTQDTGTVMSATANTLSVAGAPWTVDQFVGSYVKITSGPGKGQVRVVISNTANTVTMSQDWTQYGTPNGTSVYKITDVNENSISLGGQTMFDAGATFLMGSQYKDDLFDSANIKLAIDNLDVEIAGFNPECLVLMRGIASTETSIITYLKNNVDTQSNDLNNKFRVVIIGLASGNDNFLTYITIATGTKDRRVTLVDISEIQKDFGTGQGLVTLDGSYVAAGYAGIYCAFVDAAEPITRKSLGAVFDVDTFVDPFLVTEKNQMAAAGVTCIERQGLDIRIRHALTTDPTTIFTWEAKLTRSADFISNAVKASLEDTLTGRRFTISPTDGAQDVLLLAKSTLTFLFQSMQNPQAQIITSFSNLSVTQNQTVKQQLDIKANLFLTTDVVWEFALLGFAV